MIQTRLQFRSLSLIFIGGVFATGAAFAAGPGASAGAQARYREDMAFCDSGQSSQSLATCRTEARNAFAEAKRHDLKDAPGQYEGNALQRCAGFEVNDRADCEDRVHGLTRSEGSVEGGAIVRESVSIRPVKTP